MTQPRDGVGRAGRPGATTHEEIERFAFSMFAEHGYEGTSMAMIADGLGIGRRTLFRYFASKHDIAWGRFDDELDRFARALDATPGELPVREAVMEGLVAFNAFALDAVPSHVERMRLILSEPTLQSHSAVRYAQWRRVIESFVRQRLGAEADDPRPSFLAYLTNAVAIAAYSQWVKDPELDVARALAEMDRLLVESLA